MTVRPLRPLLPPKACVPQLASTCLNLPQLASTCPRVEAKHENASGGPLMRPACRRKMSTVALTASPISWEGAPRVLRSTYKLSQCGIVYVRSHSPWWPLALIVSVAAGCAAPGPTTSALAQRWYHCQSCHSCENTCRRERASSTRVCAAGCEAARDDAARGEAARGEATHRWLQAARAYTEARRDVCHSTGSTLHGPGDGAHLRLAVTGPRAVPARRRRQMASGWSLAGCGLCRRQCSRSLPRGAVGPNPRRDPM